MAARTGGGSRVPQEEGGEANPFRTKEKQYQLHKEQAMKHRGGKLRGYLVSKPTDLSDVLDLSTQPASFAAICIAHRLQGVAVPVYTFLRHPGLVYIPGFLSASEQLQLARSALVEVPEPPARTNHSAHHGFLPGLWTAAQQGLRLAPAAGCSLGGVFSQGRHSQHTSLHTGSSVLEHPTPGSTAAHLDSDDRGGGGTAASSTVCCHGAACDEAGGCIGCQARGVATGTSNQLWSSAGLGPTAEKLLMKLRWATLGPPYNWTTRTYELQTPHRPLPRFLLRLAADMADLFAKLGMPMVDPPVPASLGPFGGALLAADDATALASHRPQQQCVLALQSTSTGCPLRPHPASSQSAQLGATAKATATAPVASTFTTSCGSQLHPSLPQSIDADKAVPSSSSTYLPDAAIVNYYREGDTLGGHCDDAESNLAQPLVSVSLGCCAVFLMGGASKQHEPTPLMLHSGDVLVMSGPARRCYHGVPRILGGTLPEELQPQLVEEELRPVAQYLQGGRINISIRTVS